MLALLARAMVPGASVDADAVLAAGTSDRAHGIHSAQEIGASETRAAQSPVAFQDAGLTTPVAARALASRPAPPLLPLAAGAHLERCEVSPPIAPPTDRPQTAADIRGNAPGAARAGSEPLENAAPSAAAMLAAPAGVRLRMGARFLGQQRGWNGDSVLGAPLPGHAGEQLPSPISALQPSGVAVAVPLAQVEHRRPSQGALPGRVQAPRPATGAGPLHLPAMAWAVPDLQQSRGWPEPLAQSEDPFADAALEDALGAVLERSALAGGIDL